MKMRRVVLTKYVHAFGCCPQEGIITVEIVTQVDDRTNSFIPPRAPFCATGMTELWQNSQSVEVIREL